MSNKIFVGAEFSSYREYKAALDEYCQQNAINGETLRYFRQTSNKLNQNTFKNHLLDQATISRFEYHVQSLTCEYHKSNANRSYKADPYCNGRITTRFDKQKNVLRISVFDGHHENHPTHVDTEQEQRRCQQIKSIIELVKKMPDDALTSLKLACEQMLEEWGKDNLGVDIHIVPLEALYPEIIDVKMEVPVDTETERTEGNENLFQISFKCFLFA